MNEGIQKSEKNSPYSVVIGIDWADQKNDMCMIERESGAIRHLEVKQDAVALHEFAVEMRERYGREGKRIAMVVDQKRGGLINFLMGLEFVDIYPLHAARAKDYRRALYPSGAKSDPVDAQIHGEFYLKHPERFTQCLKPDTVETRELNLLCEHRRGFVDQGTQFEQQLSSSLKQYNPLIIKLFDDLGSAICLHFILRWPTLGKVQRASEGVLRKFFYKHNSRSAEKIQERLELIRKEGALTEDEATLAVYSRKVQTLAGLLLALHPQIEAYEKRIKELFRTHPDAPVFSGIPGAGDALSPRLLCAFGTDRARFEMPRNMTQWNGSAPVTISSGQDKRSGQPKRVVTWRWGAPTFIRQTFVEFAKHSTRNCDWAKAFYQIKEEEGQPCQTILRALALKWTRILFRCWKNGESYDEQKYLQALQRRGSPVWKRLQQVNANAL